MNQLSDRAVRQVGRAVVIDPDDGYPFVAQLQVPALAFRGEHDYVPIPPGITTTTLPGGHVSPWAAPEAVATMIDRVLQLAAMVSN